jgi:hypothetical protein
MYRVHSVSNCCAKDYIGTISCPLTSPQRETAPLFAVLHRGSGRQRPFPTGEGQESITLAHNYYTLTYDVEIKTSPW